MDLKNLPVEIDNSTFSQLEPREQAFVLHPEVMTNPVKAALDAGYSENTARCHATIKRKQLMYFILPLYNERLKKLEAASGITPERIKDEIANIAFANEADYYDTVDVQGDTIKVLKDITRLPERMQRAIKKVEYETVIMPDGSHVQRLIKIELYDKMKALSELTEIFGLKDPRTRNPADLANEDQAAVEQMSPEAVEEVVAIMEREQKRLKQAASKKRDKQAIPGTAKRINKE